ERAALRERRAGQEGDLRPGPADQPRRLARPHGDGETSPCGRRSAPRGTRLRRVGRHRGRLGSNLEPPGAGAVSAAMTLTADTTQLLHAARAGDREAFDNL